MRVILYPADEGGCAYVRCEQPLRTSSVDGEIRMSVEMVGKGMQDPAVPTALGVREPRNRRAEILL